MSPSPTHLIPEPPKICLNPVDLDFGPMGPNTSKVLEIKVSNCGGQQLHWSTGGGGLKLKPSEGTLPSNQSEKINVTLDTRTVKLNPGPNTLLVRFNSSNGSSIDLIVTATLKKRAWPAWTGFSAYTSPSHPEHTEIQRRKTLWDWLQLLIIPLILAAGAIGFSVKQSYDSLTLNNTQYQQSLSIAATRYAEDQRLAQEQQVETNLQTYLDRMSDLLLKPKLHNQGQEGDNIRILATARTLTILQDLDGPRRAVVLKFLHGGGLITRQDPAHPETVNPVVNLNGADFSGVDLTGFVLAGADLASVNFTGVTLNEADLSGAYLSQALLRGANLTGAKLDFTQLTGADLSCAAKDPKTCTNLTNADLSGADFAGANLAGAIFKNTEVTGTNFPRGFTTHGNVIKRKWRVFLQDNILKIDHNDGSLLPTYGQLDLNTSKLQLVYGPSANFGTSLVLLPALWSKTSCPGDYCENAAIISYPFLNSDLSQDTFPISVSGSIAGLSVKVDLSFSPPQNNSITVTVNAHVSGTTTLDQYTSSGAKLQGEAFKPVLLRAIHDSSSKWTAQEAVFGSQPPSQLSENTRTSPVNVSAFGLVGGTSTSVTNAPDITVTLKDVKAGGNDLKATVTLEVKPSSDSSVDKVGMWAGVDSLPDEWSYTVVASMPSTATAMQ